MKMLWMQGTRCIILTSGTLSPIPPLVQELGIKIPVTLENGHVVTGEQVFIGVISTGPDGTTLNSSFNTRFVNIFSTTLDLIFQQDKIISILLTNPIFQK
jgi:regulator of telomere elongation helicase 1